MDGALLRMAVIVDELKSIIEREVHDLKTGLESNHCQNRETVGEQRLMSRIADRNDIIRINTLCWVLDVIEKVEQQKKRH